MNYFAELNRAMIRLSHDPKVRFVGQGVGCAGTTMTDTLDGIPDEKLIEFPVAEDLQMGFCIGMALEGWLPVCIFPRWNFLLLAANQIVNHLDRLPIYSNGGYIPKVIIRVATPKVNGFNPGPQHDDDFTDAFRLMLRTVKVARFYRSDEIGNGYNKAILSRHSTMLVEFTELYDTVPSGVGSITDINSDVAD